MSDRKREGGRHRGGPGEGAALGNVPLAGQGGPVGRDVATTGGGAEGEPGRVLGRSAGIGRRVRDEDADAPAADSNRDRR